MFREAVEDPATSRSDHADSYGNVVHLYERDCRSSGATRVGR
jgi:pyruvate carboxylase